MNDNMARTKYVWRYGVTPKQEGLTEDVRRILKAARNPLTVREIVEKLPSLVCKHKSAVIISTLERMAVSGEAIRSRIIRP